MVVQDNSRIKAGQSLLIDARKRLLYYRMSRLLKELFTALDIASPLLSLDVRDAPEEVLSFMLDQGVEVVGLRDHGLVVGYARLTQDAEGNYGLEQHFNIPDDMILPESAPLNQVILHLNREAFGFISVLGGVEGIVTKRDVLKPPVRMWLFGMVTIIEMYLARMIKVHFGDSWAASISPGRLKKAKDLMEERLRRGEEVELLDCLQVADKAGLVLKDKRLRVEFDVNSKREAKELIKNFESLRNNLAHAQDIVANNWGAIVTMASRVDRILTRFF